MDGALDAVPFVDIKPFESSGFYDPCQYGLGWSQLIGSATRDAALFVGGAAMWRAVPVLGGGQLPLKTSYALSGLGVTPLGVASSISSGSSLLTGASLTGSVAFTTASRLSTAQQVINLRND